MVWLFVRLVIWGRLNEWKRKRETPVCAADCLFPVGIWLRRGWKKRNGLGLPGTVSRSWAFRPAWGQLCRCRPLYICATASIRFSRHFPHLREQQHLLYNCSAARSIHSCFPESFRLFHLLFSPFQRNPRLYTMLKKQHSFFVFRFKKYI